MHIYSKYKNNWVQFWMNFEIKIKENDFKQLDFLILQSFSFEIKIFSCPKMTMNFDDFSKTEFDPNPEIMIFYEHGAILTYL